MGSLWETLAVVAVVGTAAIWAGRSLWRAVRQKKVCSTCGSSGDCPLVNGKGWPRNDSAAKSDSSPGDCMTPAAAGRNPDDGSS